MNTSMPPLPPKKAVALDLLERTSVFVHLDPRRPGVIVPLVFAKQPQLVLQIGLNMAITIPDLEVNDTGISCTLSFNRRPHFCRLPWSAIYALIGQEGGGMVWPEDVPPEVVAQQRSAAKKEAPRKPMLRAIDGAGDGDSADRQESPEEESPHAQRSPAPLKAEPARKQNLRRTSSLPPRLVQQRSPQASPQVSSETSPGVSPDREQELETAAQLDPGSAPAPAPELATRSDAAGTPRSPAAPVSGAPASGGTPRTPASERVSTPADGKRARPPYLRLVR
jgi:stringent starvation protein B